MITAFVLGFAVLILCSFFIEIISNKIKFPSVFLLIVFGVLLQYSLNALHMQSVVTALPFLGTFALVLIVLEAGFDLDYRPEKRALILRTFISALVNLVICIGIFTLLFYIYYGSDLNKCILYALPFSIVSSTVAIPSAKSLGPASKEFLTYETVFSDVIGIILFNLLSTRDVLSAALPLLFLKDILFSLLLSLAFILILIFLMKKSRHRLRFIPIFSMLILFYASGKYLGLPLLLGMVMFGLILNNIEEIYHPRLKFLTLDKYFKRKITYFKSLTHELAFVIRCLFFILFGYRINFESLLNLHLLGITAGLVIIVLTVRMIVLCAIDRTVEKSLIYIAPRGLISILLALSIPQNKAIPEFSTSLLDAFVIITILIQLYARFPLKSNRPQKRAVLSSNIDQSSKKPTSE